ncbi:hypothetical protein P7H60_12345 [Vagococcus carniphilus]|uniref:hypothetical protein n=1 Tax=Vagococcus carniphilus TaxID=218144 RepID=UPI00288D7823|nr:hypothetical protein [Vagococcus carniphilus]MDT2849934.1 hypothetical protein [Vagococcus carniphilus]
MKKKVVITVTSVLFMLTAPIAFAEESDKNILNEPSTEETTAISDSDTTETESSRKEDGELSTLKSIKIRMIQIYLANNYITQAKHDEIISQVKEATTSQEIEELMNGLISSIDGLSDFTFSFSEKYYNLEANIAAAVEKNLITEVQAQTFYDRLVTASTLDDLAAISADFHKLIDDSTTGTSSTSSSTTSSMSDSSSTAETTTSTTVSKDSSEAPKKSFLPKTGELRNVMGMFAGVFITLSAVGCLLIKQR